MLWTTFWMTLQMTKRVTILWTSVLPISQTAYLYSFYSKWFPVLYSTISPHLSSLPSPCPLLQWLHLLKSTRVYPSLLLDASGEQAIVQPDCRASELFIQETLRGKKGFLYPEKLMWKSSFCIRGRWMWKSSFCIRRGEILWNLSWHVEDVLKKEMSPVWESALFCVEGLCACYSFLSL